ASVLQRMKNARFYITHGSSVKLHQRLLEDIVKAPKISDEELERRVIDRALALNKRLADLKDSDAKGDELLEAVLKRTGRGLKESGAWVRERVIGKIM